MQILDSLFNHSPLLGQLFNSRFNSMAPTQHKAAAATMPITPSPSQEAVAEMPDAVDSMQLSIQQTPATPISPPETVRLRKRGRVARVVRPAPGSLYDIMHDHCGESLFITPICWTDAHARLLGVNFVDCDPVQNPVPDLSSMSQLPLRPSRIATELSKDLTAILSPKLGCFTAHSVKRVLRTFFPATLSKAKSNVDLECRFGDHTLKRAVRVTVLWQQSDSLDASFDSAETRPSSCYGQIPGSSNSSEDNNDSRIRDWRRYSSSSGQQLSRPVLAFVNRTHLTMVRHNLYRVVPGPANGDQMNTPVLNLQRLRSKKLVPENGDHDSYLVAIMLAIAQSQCYAQGTTASSSRASSQKSSQGSTISADSVQPRPVFRDVPVRILSQDSSAAAFVVYSTVVTAAFLERFAEPTKAPSADALHNGGLKVEVTRVPIWPVLGLKERLAQALGAELVDEELSDFTEGEMETWESELEREVRLGSLKRRRETFSEVFHTSFDSITGGSPGREPPSSPALTAARLGVRLASPPLSPRTPKRRRTQARNELEVC